MKPMIFTLLIFTGILATMWLAAANHNAGYVSDAAYSLISPDIADEIEIGMTLEDVIGIIGREADGIEVIDGLKQEHKLYYWDTHNKRLHVAIDSGAVSRVFIRN